MKLEIIQPDPMNILHSTRDVFLSADFVTIDESKIKTAADNIRHEVKNTFQTLEADFGSAGNKENDTELIFIEDVVNFCFWAGKDEPRWEVQWPEGNKVVGGWYGLKACFERALAEDVPILDASYLASMNLNQAQEFFRGVDGIEIPLLTKRLENLQEAGNILSKKYQGEFLNIVLESNFDAIRLVQLITEHFLSFRDISVLKDKEIVFLKRAQIVANDLGYIFPDRLKSLHLLTAFADYRIPQILREMGILIYRKDLAEKVDNHIEIPHGSREEIEIRAGMIWGIELLLQASSLTAREIDNTLWLLGQKIENMKPYHRTRTIFY